MLVPNTMEYSSSPSPKAPNAPQVAAEPDVHAGSRLVVVVQDPAGDEAVGELENRWRQLNADC